LFLCGGNGESTRGLGWARGHNDGRLRLRGGRGPGEQELCHRGDVLRGFMLGANVALGQQGALGIREFGFDVPEVLDLFADEVGDGSVFVECLFGRAQDVDGFHM
jgi:hypothetical protein